MSTEEKKNKWIQYLERIKNVKEVPDMMQIFTDFTRENKYELDKDARELAVELKQKLERAHGRTKETLDKLVTAIEAEINRK